MYFYVMFSYLKALVSLVYLVVSKSYNQTEFGQTYDNSQISPDRIYGKWGEIKAGTNAQQQNYLASKCYLTSKYKDNKKWIICS